MWTLEHNGDEQSFAERGLSQPVIAYAATAADELRINAVQEVDADDILSGLVVVRKDTALAFGGLIVETPKRGSAEAEAGTYRALNYWHLLDQIVFHQSRKSYDNGLGQLIDVFTTHCWLGMAADGSYQTSGQQMAEALAYAQGVAAAEGLAFQFDDSTFPALDIPINEVRDVTCAEAIRLMLRWSPDAVVWLDYSTWDSGGPTFRCARRSALAPKSVDVSDGELIAELNITDRPDLLRPSVKLTYEIAEQANGAAYVRTQEDIFPAGATGREVGALAATINLQGAAVQTVEQEIVTQPIEALSFNAAARLNWWKQQFPELAGADVQSVQIDLPDTTRSSTLPNQLVDGALADWMNAVSEPDLITAKAFILDDTGGHWKTLPVRLLATNAQSGTYRYSQAMTHPEPIPAGLAEDVFAGVSALHWQGDLLLREAEATLPAAVGNALNLTGGRAEWESMNALIYRAAVDIERGETRIEFGNPDHLGVADLVELLRASRSRNLQTLPAARTSGIAGSGAAANFAKQLPNRINTGKETAHEKHIVKKDGKGEINVDAAEAFDLDDALVAELINDKVLRVRELPICLDGEDKKILVIASQPYDAD